MRLVLVALAVGRFCFGPVTAAAEESAAASAAVLPTGGDLATEVRIALTIEFRRGLARRGYRLIVQDRVRDAAAALPDDELPRPRDLTRLAAELGAEVLIAARVEVIDGEGPTVTALGLCPDRGLLGPVRAPLRPTGDALTRSDLARFAERLLADLLAAFAIALPGEAPRPPPEESGFRMPEDMESHDAGEWQEADHAGFFADLSFLFTWCAGDLLCSTTGTGYGGRLRLGYRIASYVAISATAAVGGHDVPTSTDIEVLADIERSLLWFGFHGGVRGHPLNRSWFDPFFGIDLGWTRLFYTEEVEGGDEDCIPDYMGIDTCRFNSLRNVLYMDGFTVTPQAGVNLFITRNVALGVVAAFQIPVWSEVCNKTTLSAPGQKTAKDTRCVDVDDAGADFMQLEHGTLDDRGQLPWHLNLELHFSFVF